MQQRGSNINNALADISAKAFTIKPRKSVRQSGDSKR